MPEVMSPEKRRLEGPVRPTALIVDREPLYRWFVSEALGPSHVHVVQCRTLDDADGFLQSQRADLLLADEFTVRSAGPDALDHLMRLARSIPCVVLDSSGNASRSYLRDRAVVVDKPVDASALARLVEHELHRQVQRIL